MYRNNQKFSFLIPFYALLAAINTGLVQGFAHGATLFIIEILVIAVVKFDDSSYFNRIFSCGSFHFIGKISYSLYLSHVILGFALIHYFESVTGVWLGRFCALVVIILWSIILNRYAENHATPVLRKYLEKQLVHK